MNKFIHAIIRQNIFFTFSPEWTKIYKELVTVRRRNRKKYHNIIYAEHYELNDFDFQFKIIC